MDGTAGLACCDCAVAKQEESRRQARRIRMAPPLYNTSKLKSHPLEEELKSRYH
jgi:hypothetical protein